jgi:hypothetical protein
MGSHVALVKGNRQMGFQVDRATHIFFWFNEVARWDLMLVLVKGDRRTGSQVSPTTQILILVQGDRPMGSHRKKKEERKKKRKKHLEFFLYKAYYAKH